MNKILKNDREYSGFLNDIKNRVQSAQIKAAVTVNHELLDLYWDMAAKIVEKQKKPSWGDGFLEQMSKGLQKEFPKMKGFSLRNLKCMRQWYLFWSDSSFGQQAVAKFPGGIISLLSPNQITSKKLCFMCKRP